MLTASGFTLYFRRTGYKSWEKKIKVHTDVYAVHEIRSGGGWSLMECYDCGLHQKNIKGQEWSEVKELIKISKLEINTIIRSWTRDWKIISGRAIKKPFRASIKVITIKGSASSKCHEKLIMIANQKKWSPFSEGSGHIRNEMKQGTDRGGEGRRGNRKKGMGWGRRRRKKKEYPPHLIPRRLVCGHMPLKLSAVSKRVVAQGAGEVLLVLLMAVLDVLL